MLIGIACALAGGVGFGFVAAVQKREATAVDAPLGRLLPALARRPAWLVAAAGSTLAWIAQVVAFSRLPIAVVMPFLGLGTGVLVVLGIRWLGERFTPAEVTAVGALAAAAVLTASVSGGGRASATSVAPWVQLAVFGVAIVAGVALARGSSGLAVAAASGIAFVVTSLLSKEVADRFASDGPHAITSLLLGPTPWLLAAAAYAGTTFEQMGFQRANAATVSAVTSAVDVGGTVVVGTWLFHEPRPTGLRGAVVIAGLVLATAGLLALGRAGRAAVETRASA